MPPVLVGKWAPDCRSIAGEIYGASFYSDGRIEANDGAESCWLESITLYAEQNPSPDRLSEWIITGRCENRRASPPRNRTFKGAMWLTKQALPDGKAWVMLERQEGPCSWFGGSCHRFLSMERCAP